MYFSAIGSMSVVSNVFLWEANINYCCEIYFALCSIRRLQCVVGKVKQANKELNATVNRVAISHARCVPYVHENLSHNEHPLMI